MGGGQQGQRDQGIKDWGMVCSFKQCGQNRLTKKARAFG